jgi:aminoglycoside phosphotransferase (APT) family kinase protein
VPPDLDAYRRAAGRWFYRKADLDVPDAVLAELPARRAAFAASAQAAVEAQAARVLGLASCAAEATPGGTLHAVFVLRDAGSASTWYARVALPGLGEPAAELLVDRIASEAAVGAGLPAPRVRHVDLTRSRVPFDLEILDAAPGRRAAAGPEGAGARRALGAALATLHGVRGAGWGPLDPARPAPRGLRDSWRDFVLERLEEHVGTCVAAGALLPGEAETLRGAFREAEPLLATAPAAVCHGDLATPNVLVDEAGRVTALLDWEDALVGDPLFDLAGWGTFVGHHERRGAVLEGYATRARLPADAELRYWLYYVRIILAKTIHRRRFGYARTDRIPAGERIRPALTALTAALGRSG